MDFIHSGHIYKWFIDPLLSPIQYSALKYIKPSGTVIDIASGTGAFALRLAKISKSVTGIDSSLSMIKMANKSAKKSEIQNANFLLDDATNLHNFGNNSFDYATLSMAVHQFPFKLAIQIVKEAKRISKEIVIIDYAYPLPKNKYKTLTYLIERLAGKKHYKAFKYYQAIGGLEAVCKKVGLSINHSKTKGNGIFTIASCSNAHSENKL